MSELDIFNSPPSPASWRKLGAYLRKHEVTAGMGLRMSRDSAAGTIISAASRANGVPPVGYNHPFKIDVRNELNDDEDVETRLYVNYGAISTQGIRTDEAPSFVDITTAWDFGNSLYLANDPIYPTGTVGYSILSPETTYGVWLVLQYVYLSIANTFPTTDDYANIAQWYVTPSACNIVVSSSQTDMQARYSGATSPGKDIGFPLGIVTIDAYGAATVKQHRRSDLVVPCFALPDNIEFP